MKQLLFAIFLSLTVVAQQSPNAPAPGSSPAAQPAASDQQAQASLIVFREAHFNGSGLKPSIYVDGKEVARLKNGTFLTMKIDPGKHDLDSSSKHEAALQVEIKPGETSYVQMIIVNGTWRGAGRLVPVSAEDGKAATAKLKPLDLKE